MGRRRRRLSLVLIRWGARLDVQRLPLPPREGRCQERVVPRLYLRPLSLALTLPLEFPLHLKVPFALAFPLCFLLKTHLPQRRLCLDLLLVDPDLVLFDEDLSLQLCQVGSLRVLELSVGGRTRIVSRLRLLLHVDVLVTVLLLSRMLLLLLVLVVVGLGNRGRAKGREKSGAILSSRVRVVRLVKRERFRSRAGRV